MDSQYSFSDDLLALEACRHPQPLEKVLLSTDICTFSLDEVPGTASRQNLCALSG